MAKKAKRKRIVITYAEPPCNMAQSLLMQAPCQKPTFPRNKG